MDWLTLLIYMLPILMMMLVTAVIFSFIEIKLEIGRKLYTRLKIINKPITKFIFFSAMQVLIVSVWGAETAESIYRLYSNDYAYSITMAIIWGAYSGIFKPRHYYTA